tara:strand:- start:1270 stop:1575 length:306 start_codon:yes stop_codon:yes gene_type:complete
MIIEVNDSNFEKVIKENKLVLIDFWAEWCGPCRMYGSILEKFSEENPNVVIGKVNVDSAPEAAAKYAIRSIPTTIVFDDGEVTNKLPGALSKEKLVEITKL